MKICEGVKQVDSGWISLCIRSPPHVCKMQLVTIIDMYLLLRGGETKCFRMAMTI